MLGKTVGFLLGLQIGPFAALVGLLIGHFFDRNAVGIVGRRGTRHTAEVQHSFFSTVFLLLGQLAKADGQVTAQEIAQTELFMRQMGLTPDHRAQAIELFKQGRATNFDTQPVLQEFNRVCGKFGNLRQMLLAYLIGVAFSDGSLHPSEDRALRQIATAIGFSTADYETLLEMIRAQNQFAGFGGSGQQSRFSQAGPTEIMVAYKALGVTQEASDKEVTKAYRKLINEYHPDKLIGQGMPEDMIQMATERSQEVQIAYDLIKRSRKT